MEGTNDNNKRGSSITSLESTLPSKYRTSASLQPPPFASDLVTRTKLLTREEECTLKTALAFVVIKARATAKSNAALQNASNIDYEYNTAEKQRTIGPPDATRDVIACDSSVLDHMFGNRKTSRNHERNFREPIPSRSLECTRDRHHIDYMFRAAKTLAETWLIAQRQESKPEVVVRTTQALEGATGHLAHQLHVLLAANTSSYCNKTTTTTSNQYSTAKQNNRKERKQTPSRKRYRRPSIASNKSEADSTSTPLTSSRKMASHVIVVTPAENNSKRYKSSQSQNHSIENDNNLNDEEGNIEEESNKSNGSPSSRFVVQEWILSTLLDEDTCHHHNGVTTRAVNENGITEKRASTTILSRQKTSTLDVVSSFQMYSIMVPQLARISPPLIGHIFQVVAKLVRDLYNDKIVVIGEDSSCSGEDQFLDHLATSALKLLELCWTTEIAIGGGRNRESHRSFLLLSLQEILGDLLVPLSRQELAGEYYRLTMLAARRQTALRKESLVLQSNHRGSLSQFSQATKHRKNLRQKAGIEFGSNGVVPRISHAQRTLDPEAKILLRMAVYRLILMNG